MSPVPALLSVVPQFTVPDLAATGAYYRDVLGFEIESYWDGSRATREPPENPVFLIVRRGPIQFFFNRGRARHERAAGAYDAYLRVTGLAALAEEFQAKGAEVIEGPEVRSYGPTELVLRDCNGLILAFGEDA